MNKKLLLVTVFVLLLYDYTTAQQWQPLGPEGSISPGEGFSPSIALDSSGTPYVVYINDEPEPDGQWELLSVQRFNGETWEYVGTPFFGTTLGNSSSTIVLDSSDRPYVAARDNSGHDDPFVYRFDGTRWDGNLRDPTSFSPWRIHFNRGTFPDIAISSTDVPYITHVTYYGAVAYRLIDQRWEAIGGNDPVEAGAVPISDDRNARLTTIALDTKDTPYVAYVDARLPGDDGKLRIKYFNGISWEFLGDGIISEESASSVTLVIGTNDIIYAAYSDTGDSGRGVVKYFDGTSWKVLGNSPFTDEMTDVVSIALDTANTPHVMYRDGGNMEKATVKRFNGMNWETVGQAGFSQEATFGQGIAVDDTGKITVVYAQFRTANDGIFVKTFDPMASNLPEITGFNLVDAENNTVLFPITEGMVINKNILPTSSLSIVARATSNTESAFLEVSGAQNSVRTENVPPYALFGDRKGNFFGRALDTGSYSITATPYSENRLGGAEGTPLSINFEIVEGNTPDFEVSFTEFIQPLYCGSNEALVRGMITGTLGFYEIDLNGPVSFAEPLTIELTTTETNFSLFSLVAGDYVFKVIQERTGATEILEFTLEDPDLPEVSLSPFAAVLDTDAAFPLTGGSPEGGWYSGPGVSEGRFDPAAVGAGDYEIVYTFGERLTGCKNSAVQVISVVADGQNAVTGFVLVNAATNEDVGPITDGAVFTQVGLLTTNLSIRAETTSDVESVRLELTGPLENSRTENVAPYALFGDRAGNYFGRLFPLGSFSITATPYSENGLRGDQGTTVTVSFSIALPQSEAPPNAMLLYPNPASESISMNFELPTNLISIQVFDINGRLVREVKVEARNGDYQMPVFDLPVGSYFVRTVDTMGTPFTQQMVIER